MMNKNNFNDAAKNFPLLKAGSSYEIAVPPLIMRSRKQAAILLSVAAVILGGTIFIAYLAFFNPNPALQKNWNFWEKANNETKLVLILTVASGVLGFFYIFSDTYAKRLRIKINADGVEILTKKLLTFRRTLIKTPVQLKIDQILTDQNYVLKYIFDQSMAMTIFNDFENYTLHSDLADSEIELLHYRIQTAIEQVRNNADFSE